MLRHEKLKIIIFDMDILKFVALYKSLFITLNLIFLRIIMPNVMVIRHKIQK